MLSSIIGQKIAQLVHVSYSLRMPRTAPSLGVTMTISPFLFVTVYILLSRRYVCRLSRSSIAL